MTEQNNGNYEVSHDEEILEEEKKIARIIFQYQDGSVRYVEGSDANTVMNQMESAAIMAFVHGVRTEAILWTESTTEQIGQIASVLPKSNQ